MIFRKIHNIYNQDYIISYFIFNWPIISVTNIPKPPEVIKRIQLSPVGGKYLMIRILNRIIWIRIKKFDKT